MKLTTMLILAGCLQVSARTFAQTVTLSVKNTSLEKVFLEINRQTGYNFVYNSKFNQVAKPVSVEVKQQPLEFVLNECFREQKFTYEIIDKTIIIKEKSLIFKNGHSISATIDVRGRVVDTLGQPLVGAGVKVRGSRLGTTTNENGYFILKGIESSSMLEISFTGYSMKVMPAIDVQGLSEIVLRPVTNVLGDVTLVNTGYQQTKPNEITGSVVTITKEQLDQRVAPDIISKLEGITNSLVFNKSATTGKNSIRIRGESTLYGYTEPLIVVDNFPYDGSIDEINPNDVESVTILKDAAAASIWGVRAGNGVIVITTKAGKYNRKLKLSFTANTTLREEPNLFYSPQFSSSDFIDFEIFLYGRGKYSADLTANDRRAVSPIVDILDRRSRGLITQADSANLINSLRSNDWRNEFLDNLYQNSITQQYQVNFSGGDSKSNYYLSTGFDKSISNLIGDKSSRISITGKYSYNPIKNLYVSTTIAYVEGRGLSNGSSSIPNYYPYMKLKSDSGDELSIPQHRSIFEDTIVNRGFSNWKYYPLAERLSTDNTSNNYSTRMQASIKYMVIKGLNIDVSYQYYRTMSNSRSYRSSESYFIRDNVNRFAILNTAGLFSGTNYPVGGMLSIASANIIGHNGRAKVDFQKNWREHNISAIAGFEIREIKNDGNSFNLLGYDDDNGSFATPNLYTSFPTYPSGNATLGGGAAQGLSYSGKIDRFKSYFTNLAYTYRSKYTFSLSSRLDGSNYFGVTTNNKVVPLWSTGFKWDIISEKFFKQTILDELSLRVTYGFNGNLSPDVAAITTFGYQNSASYTGLPYAVINNIPNPELRWEKSEQFNLGLSFAAKSISGNIEYFRKKGKDLIGTTFIDPTTGVDILKGNFSDMRTRGVDVQLNFRTKVSKGLHLSTTLIFNYAAEKVTRFDVPSAIPNLLTAYSSSGTAISPQVGYPIMSVFSYRWGGLDPVNGDPRILLSDTLNKTFTNATLNNIKFGDLVYNGRYNPPFFGSLTNTLAWKDLSLTFNILYKLGHVFRRGSIRYNDLVNNWKAGHSDFISRWRTPGDEIYTIIPSFVYPSNNLQQRDNFFNNADVLIEKADHFRLQFININYNVRGSLIRKLKIEGLDFYFYANNLNLLLWRANKRGIDPEYPYLSYPPSRSYSVGLRATL